MGFLCRPVRQCLCLWPSAGAKGETEVCSWGTALPHILSLCAWRPTTQSQHWARGQGLGRALTEGDGSREWNNKHVWELPKAEGSVSAG